MSKLVPRWSLMPVMEPLTASTCYEHTPLDYYRYGEYPRFLRPVDAHQPRWEWKRYRTRQTGATMTDDEIDAAIRTRIAELEAALAAERERREEAEAELATERERREAAEAALRELVSVDDERDRIIMGRLYGEPHLPEHKALELDNRQRRLEAWRAARNHFSRYEKEPT